MTDRSSDPDRTVIASVLDGETARYAELVERYERRLLHTMVRAIGDRADAEELTQEAFVRAYFALPSYDPQFAFSTWLFKIAINLSINHRKKQGRDRERLAESVNEPPDGASPSKPASPAGSAESGELAEKIRDAIDRLPDEFRDIFVMRHFYELSYREICDATGLPMGTVKSRLIRARRRLGQELGGRT
jgi:RNA polymerase sigma-70 factor (ECF subfamily)